MSSATKLMKPGPRWSVGNLYGEETGYHYQNSSDYCAIAFLYVKINERAQALTKTDRAQNRQNTSIAWL